MWIYKEKYPFHKEYITDIIELVFKYERSKVFLKITSNWAWQHRPVIPEAQEAEAGGWQVQTQPRQLSEALSNSMRPCL